MMTGIVSYGTYVPRYRLKSETIDRMWNRKAPMGEKSVPGGDEDAITMAVEAAMSAIKAGQINPKNIEAILMGSESHPYAVNPSSTIVGNLIGTGNNYLAADLEFACKAGTAAVQLVTGMIESGRIKLGLAIGSDTAQGKPGDALEYNASAAAAAVVMGKENVAVKLLQYCSYSSDTPDFWRRDGVKYPTHAGRFTGEPAYFAHISAAAEKLLEITGITPQDADYCVFHMPNPKFPRDIAKKLGFSQEQLAPSLIVDKIGNPYSASSLSGLAAVLDQAKPGQKIFMVSYGSGAGSDAFWWETQPDLIQLKRKVQDQRTREIDYLTYIKQTHKI